MLNLRRIFATSALALLAASATACGGMSEGDYTVYRVSFGQALMADSCFDGDVPASITEDSSTLLTAGTFILYIGADDTPMLDTGSLVLEGKDNGNDSYSFSGESRDVEIPTGNIIWDSDHDGLDDYNGDDPFVDADEDGLDDTDFALDTSVDVDGDGLDDRFEDDIVDLDHDGQDDRMVEIPMDAKYVTTDNVTITLTIDDELLAGKTQNKTMTTCTGAECLEDFGTECTMTIKFSGIEIEDANVEVNSP